MSADPAIRAAARQPMHEQMQALRRLALAATRPAGEEIYQELVAEVARALQVTLAMVSVFADGQRRTMRTLAIVLNGQPVPESVEYPLAQSPCVEVVGRGYCFMPGGVMARYGVDKMVADLGLDAYAAFPMNDSRGEPLGLVAALDRHAIAGGDADHAEAVLKIAALRLGAELERSAADAALRRSEASYRAIFEAAEDCIFIHDWDSGRFIDVNPKACSTYGYAREELLQLTVADVSSGVPPYTAQDALRWMALAREGRCPPFEWQRRNKDGSLHWDEVRLKPVTIDGRPHVLAVTRDITERKAAEEHLRDQQQRYRAIFDGSADPIVLWNRRLEVVDVNAAFERTTGYARELIVGRHWSARPDADDLRKLLPLIEGALAGREGRVVERVTRADGSLFDIELRYLPMSFGGQPHALGIGRDVSAQRAAEAERTALEAQLRQAQKMEAIGQLTGGIAHDFNNILTSVIGYLVLAQERAQGIGDAALLRQLGSAQAAAQRARELIAQMLAFARRQRGDRRVIALAPAVRQGLQLLRSTLPSSVVLDDQALAAADALPPVRADAVQIEQVLFNLCLNARDAMPRGGRITVRLAEQGDVALRCTSCGSDIGAGRWLRLAVSDTGTGIDPAVVSRMFEPFFTTKEVGRGSGMGLAMVHGIVHEHEGHVVVESDPGGGAHFHVLLPVADGEADAPVAAVPVAAGGRRFRGRVMVVEDEPMVAAFMRELLEGWGLEVVVPPDALSALRWFDDPAQQVDLLITDLTMPQLGGLDLAHHVGVLRPQLPVLLYSGDADAVDADALRRAGVAAVLGKPVDPQALAALLGRWLPAR
jgi:PAS domain S-box-containing protein